ncbi:unnamed protein product [Vitrella brassicaformis CCMP3155]|uniref:Uncharacterized protein n=1 Tax=Vitrella brassicaformis (strain CCMP3155) TaxID=1169540 RepID=A0A0G4EII2_VITBC|nr:unnamed protein product [Vitrella brassicaformis CCMP3155]|eukprot:CEL95692.1 unnamed protein product [Vitrella brassicaformis CCMP3155]
MVPFPASSGPGLRFNIGKICDSGIEVKFTAYPSSTCNDYKPSVATTCGHEQTLKGACVEIPFGKLWGRSYKIEACK